MKNSIKFILIFTLVFVSLSFSVYAYENITVDSNTMNIVVDGERVFADNFVYSNTTYVPLRRVAEMLGKKVDKRPQAECTQRSTDPHYTA